MRSMESGIVFRWITPGVLDDPTLRHQKKLLSKAVWFAQRMQKEDPHHGLELLAEWRNRAAVRRDLDMGGILLLALKHETPIGCLLFHQIGGWDYVTYFTAVRPGYRNLHVARNLTYALLRYVRNRGGGRVHRTLQGAASRAWHQKWAEKKPRVQLRKGKPPQGSERVTFPKSNLNHVQITVRGNPAPLPGTKWPYHSKKFSRPRRKP